MTDPHAPGQGLCRFEIGAALLSLLHAASQLPELFVRCPRCKNLSCSMSRWVLVTPGQCPPENTPLVSSVDELAQDKARIDEWKAKASASFPGRDASFDDKLKWYHAFNESAYEDFWSSAPEPPEYVPAVLLDACDDSVELQLIIKRGEASLLNKINDESKAKFMASAERARGEPLRQRVLNKARSTEKGLAAYVEWLADGENGAPSCEMRSKTTPKPVTLLHSDVGREPFDDVVVAARTVAKGDCAGSAIKGLMRDAGLCGSCMAPAITSDWSIIVHNAGDGVEKVGENVFYVDKRGKCCVALELQISTGESKQSESTGEKKFHEECKALEEAHADETLLTMGADPKDKGDKSDTAEPKAEWPDSDSSDESEDAADEMSKPPVQALWLPKFYYNERKRMFAHVHLGAGETTSIKQRLQKGNTDTGNVKFGLVEAEWDWLQKRFKGDDDREQKYFCGLLALTHAMCASDHWMYDNEYVEEIGDFCKKLASKWREHLKKDEAALGLGLDGAGAAHTPAASKKALVRLLNWFKTRIEAHPDTDYKLSLATRKRRADAGMPKAKKAKK